MKKLKEFAITYFVLVITSTPFLVFAIYTGVIPNIFNCIIFITYIVIGVIILGIFLSIISSKRKKKGKKNNA